MNIKNKIYKIWFFFKKTKALLKRYFVFCRYHFKYSLNSFLNPIFNTTLKLQEKNFKSIPIIIINFNQLTYLKKLVDFLQEKEYNKIVIIDNKSTYKPLLNYYKTIENSIDIIMNPVNEGHRVFWKNKAINKKYGKGYYVVTDSDIVPTNKCPDNFLLHFKKILDTNKRFTKVGFSLKIDDIPKTNTHRDKILKWEEKFWKNTTKEGHYIADIDTTFALYRPLNQFEYSYFYKSLRLKSPYIAKHGGWYIDTNNLNDEQKYYMKHTTKSSSWRVDINGNLIEKYYD